MQARNSGTRLTSMAGVGPNYRPPTRCDKYRSAHRDVQRDSLRLDIRRNVGHRERHAIASRREPPRFDDESLGRRTVPLLVAIEFEHDRRGAAEQASRDAGERREAVTRMIVRARIAAARQTVDLGV